MSDRSVTNPLIVIGAQPPVPIFEILKSRESRERYLARYHDAWAPGSCLCREGGVDIAVGLREQTYYLYTQRRADRELHAAGCPLGKEWARQATGPLAPKPFIEPRGTRVNVNIDAPGFFWAHPKDSDTEMEQHTRLPGSDHAARRPSPPWTLHSLLELIWFQAGFCTWSPAFEGKRAYGLIQARTQKTVEDLDLNGKHLGPVFYMPPPFAEHKKAAIELSRERFLEALDDDERGRRRYGYILGVVKKFIPRCAAGGIRLAHSSMAMWMEPEVCRQHVQALTAAAGREGDEGVRTLALVRVARQDSEKTGNAWLSAKDVALMDVHYPSWIPVANEYEEGLVDTLVHDGRHFSKPVSIQYAGEDDPLIPSLILRDREDRCHLEILEQMENPQRAARAAFRRQRYRECSQAAWWWDVEASEESPVIPDPDARKAAMV